MSMKDIISDILNGEHSLIYPWKFSYLIKATIETADDLADTFDIWGIDPLWHQPNENGNDQVIYWVLNFLCLRWKTD